MCGIFGYVGGRNAAAMCLEGLKRLEYRGYDSAGIAGVTALESIEDIKEIGRIQSLELAVAAQQPQWGATVAHTRWATHGQVSRENAHPHVSHSRSLAIVHNGIIENHEELRQELALLGVQWRTQTDTEVVAELISHYDQGDVLVAIAKTVQRLQGSFALAVVHRDHPDWIFLAVQDCPLAIGCGEREVFVASDARAFGEHTQQVLYLESGELATVQPGKVSLFDFELRPHSREPRLIQTLAESMSKAGFPHYMLKEICEQPQVVRDTCALRLLDAHSSLVLPELQTLLQAGPVAGQTIESVCFMACGTSFHAGCLGALWLEELARIPCAVEIASEYRYRDPLVSASTLSIAISQSGETADTLAALREAQRRKSPALGICNVEGSTLAREADQTLYLRAGLEVSVASTKAFTSQLSILAMVAIDLASRRGLASHLGSQWKQDLQQVPSLIERVLDTIPLIRQVAEAWAHHQRFFFVGRRHLVPVAHEGALKLKEIAYVDAQGYAAGELKHGPIALIDSKSPTIALCANQQTAAKLASNLSEIRARGGPVCAIAFEQDRQWDLIADYLLPVPACADWIAPFASAVVCQLFAYFVAAAKGCEIDRPKNLAKSVTVE